MISNCCLNYSLNEQQKAAVTSTKGPLLIVSGPGTGKTGTLIHRIAFLIKDKHIPPENILAVTFTNKAAEEMKNRIADLIAKDIHSFHIGTFHYICSRILKNEIHLLGYGRDFVIYDENDRTVMVSYLLSQISLKGNRLAAEKISSAISDIKNMVISTDALQDIKEIYSAYQDMLRKDNTLDFDDLILKTIEIFEKFPDVLQTYQNRFKYIMVDEYQDINKPQYRLIHLLAGSHKNLCVIGDADQAIYSFRGANIQNFLHFKEDYPDAAQIRLEQNYRSTKVILDASHKIISQNSERLDTRVWTNNNDSGDKIKIICVYNEKEEAKRIAGEIEKQMGGTTFSSMDIAKDGVSAQAASRCFSDFAVLYRVHAQSRHLEEIFVRSGIPYQIIGGLKFYDRKEVKDITAYLRLINNMTDNISFLRIINIPPRQIGEQTVSKIKSYAQLKGLSYFNASLDEVMINILGQPQKEALKRFTSLIAEFRSFANSSTVDVLIEHIVKETGMESYYNDGTEKGVLRMENIAALISSAARFGGLSPAESLLKFLEEISLTSSTDSFDPRAKAVTLMSMHAAKGLEFPVVFVCGVEDGLIPYARPDNDAEEERRLFYVGMTRAKRRLYLLYAKRRFIHGQTCKNPPSSFLSNIPSDFIDKIDYSYSYMPKKKRENPQLSLFG